MRKIKKWCAVLLCAALLFSFTLPISASAAQTTARRIVIQNGMAQPTLTVSNVRNNGYYNNNSDILRFIVYVETDYDTDMDGKPDLHTVEPRYLLMGDANRDGIITIGDGSMIQKAAIGLVDMSDMSYKIGDVNGDGKITVSDTTCIQRYLTSYKTGFGITGQDYKN